MYWNATVIGLVLSVACTSSGLAQEQSQLSEKEKARIRAQVQALKESKLKQGEILNTNTRNDALRQGQNIDQKVEQANKTIDNAVENFSPRWGSDVAGSLGNAKKAQIKEMAAAQKAQIAAEARKKGAVQAEAAKKSADSIDQSVEGLKSQVSKSGKFGLQPKGSSPYIRNYGGKSNK